MYLTMSLLFEKKSENITKPILLYHLTDNILAMQHNLQYDTGVAM